MAMFGVSFSSAKHISYVAMRVRLRSTAAMRSTFHSREFAAICASIASRFARVPCTSCATNARSCALIASASPSAVSMASVSCISS